MLTRPRVNGIGTAVPEHRFSQRDAKNFFSHYFRNKDSDLDRLVSVFDNSRIKTRYSAMPLEWFEQPHTFSELNALIEEHAVDLATRAAQRAIDDAEIMPKDIEAIVFVSSTGVAAPSLDVRLIQKLGLSRHTARKPIFGLGCAGGVAGMAHASDLAQGKPGHNVLLVAVEMCTLTFQREDASPANMVSASLFSDGAAAAVLNTWGSGPELIGGHHTLIPMSEDVLGWDIIDSGLKVRLSPDLPSVVLAQLPQIFEDACDKWGVTREEIRHFVLHPGGNKVLEGYAHCLGLNDDNLRHSRNILENYGNMSSPTAIFVLQRFLEETPPQGDYALMIGFGPGFSADQTLLRW